jgi:hypothetical protein
MTGMNDFETKYLSDRAAATTAALALCAPNIREWLIACTKDDDGVPYSFKDSFSGDNVEWFDVGHNATHYFSLGVRSDGVLIQRVSGPKYDEDCQCWHDNTDVRIISSEDAGKGYWGHM